jgi:hypothetical protein
VSALAFCILALVLAGPVPVLLARASWPLRAPRAAIVLWQAIALAAVLSAFSAGIAIASQLLVPGPDGRPTATLTTLSANEISAILSHERAHLRARHDLVLEMFTAVHAAFPRFVRSASALDAVKLLIELLADDAAVRVAGPTPLARALVACAGGHTPSGAMAVGGPTTLVRVRRLCGDGNSLSLAVSAYLAAAAILIVPTVALAVPWLTELQRLFGH